MSPRQSTTLRPTFQKRFEPFEQTGIMKDSSFPVRLTEFQPGGEPRSLSASLKVFSQKLPNESMTSVEAINES